jgi:ADP-ribosyl-[dinitrogen reductase] hydrolase
MAANLGEDADTTAAITGQLAGALYGASGIPEIWISRVAWGEQIRVKAATLIGKAMLDKSQTSSP